MANPDSFIDEVTDEVRRDRLFAFFRRWAWLAVLIVIVLVGGAAYIEYRRAQTEATAEAFGNAVIAALDAAEPAARVAALDEIVPPGPEGEVLLALLAAGEAAAGAEAAERLRAAAGAPDLPPRYGHLALLKAHLLDPAPPAEARIVLGGLAEPGAPYAALAEEQLALLDISEGDIEAGLERLRRLEIAAGATPALQQRVGQLIVAIESGAELSDAPPATEAEPVTGAELDGGAVDFELGGDDFPLPEAEAVEGTETGAETPVSE
ncbi:hypothetical protein P6F26_10020 [Roseibacterium sp. SDUM158017]|uniref:hypothetical protein n=1 Tax=Roseicyclus salinarum TaxID=3036773 RepID=UPI0024157A5A|nr:hypothetical protein [Roseibacterium sp. SDUM158017]MDG4648779.1 hypothetical protein [Roseibacterium sp. SDUM158017]